MVPTLLPTALEFQPSPVRSTAHREHFAPNNPCLEGALKFGQSLGPSLVRWREEIVQDVALLREQLQSEQESWLESAPEHVRKVYWQGGDQFVLQPLVVLHLEFPGTAAVADELQFGSKVLGPLPQGTNWDVRQDAEYSRPLTRSQFIALNCEHKKTLRGDRRSSEHSETMLQEVAKEQQRDRFQGPFDPGQVAASESTRASR